MSKSFGEYCVEKFGLILAAAIILGTISGFMIMAADGYLQGLLMSLAAVLTFITGLLIGYREEIKNEE